MPRFRPIRRSGIFLAALTFAAALTLATATVSPSFSAIARPNILLIMTDDQGWADLGIHGNPKLETPNIDRFARESVRLSRFYNCPVCTPTRAALMTGRYPQRTGAIDTYQGHDTMAADEVTIAQTLKSAGYRTGLVGKWHLGRYRKYHPNERGFDRFFGFWQYGFINRYFDSDELFENEKPVVTSGYVTDVLTEEAIRFVEGDKTRPFFLYLAYNAPHGPFLAPDAEIQKYLNKGTTLRDAQYYAMIDLIDRGVGRVLGTVDRLGMRENTLVLFLTDNGTVSGTYSAGLRGLKGSTFEGGIRVPFFARWPKGLQGGRELLTPAQNIDVFPMLCEAAGAPLPAGRSLDGRSLLPLLKGDTTAPPHRYLYHQWTRDRPDPDRNWAIHEGRWKLANGLLFDLEGDPGETKDLAAQEPERTRTMRQAFLDWFRDVTSGQTYERVPIEIGRPDENPVEIDLTWGDPRGKAVRPRYRDYHRDVIANWTVPGDAVEWKVDVVRSGRYAVEMEYGCPPLDAGGTYRLTVGKASLSGETVAGGRTDVTVPRGIVGTMRLRKGPGVLRLEAVTVPGRSLMELHRLYLRRVGD